MGAIGVTFGGVTTKTGGCNHPISANSISHVFTISLLSYYITSKVPILTTCLLCILGNARCGAVDLDMIDPKVDDLPLSMHVCWE